MLRFFSFLAFGLALLAAPPAVRAEDASVSVMALATPGPLGDRTLGDPKAPVTVIEYASMTCSHCARFHNETFAAFKAKYIDTGKVHFIFREYPLDGLAAATFMVARCAPEPEYFDLVGLLFETQKDWAFVPDPLSGLATVLGPKGFDKAKIEACAKDQAILDHVLAVRDRADKNFAITGTPTFFFNGERHSGALTIEQVDQIMATKLSG